VRFNIQHFWYRRNPSLQEYVLVSAETIEIELFRKTDTDDWRIINYQAGDTVELKSINLTCQIEQIYEDIVFSEQKS
jgi:Uma2 family endonuclease